VWLSQAERQQSEEAEQQENEDAFERSQSAKRSLKRTKSKRESQNLISASLSSAMDLLNRVDLCMFRLL